MKNYLLLFLFYLCFISVNAQDSSQHILLDYILFPKEAMLPVNGKVDIKIAQFSDNLSDASLYHLYNPIPEKAEWTIDGKSYSNQSAEEGKFVHSPFIFDEGTYTAPSKIPPHNPVVLTFSFIPYKQKAKVILYSRIYISDKLNAFQIGGNKGATGALYELKEPLTGTASLYSEMGIFSRGQWNILINGFRNTTKQPMGLAISFTGDGVGAYQWSVNEDKKNGLIPPCNTVSVQGIDNGGQPFQYGSYDCKPHGESKCQLVPLEGKTTVTVFDTKNKIIKGYFSGILMSPKYEYVSVSGAFYAHIQ